MESQTNLLQVLVESPGIGIPSQALIVNTSTTLRNLKLSLLLPRIPLTSQTLDSLYFTFQGKSLHDSATLLDSHVTTPLSTLILRMRALGGGGDGGATGAESRDCYLNMYAVKKPDKVDPNETRLSRWTNCALSFEPLKPPCVTDRLGNVFNKQPLVEGLLGKKLPKEFGVHIKGLKDMIPIQLYAASDGSGFQCPISGLEFNGKYKFFALRGCGHVLSAKALKEVKSSGNCLVCQGEYSETVDKIPINGSVEEVAALREKLEIERAANVRLREKRKEKKTRLNGRVEDILEQLSGTKHGVTENVAEEKYLVKCETESRKMANGDVDVKGGVTNAVVKRFKSSVVVPPNATKAVYESIFTSSKKSDFKETYSCRSLPLGRN